MDYNGSFVGDLVNLGSISQAFFQDLECCDSETDCADPGTGGDNCFCEDF